MNGNDIGCWTNSLNTDLPNLLSNVVRNFHQLKELHLSDCKLFFPDTETEISCIKLLNTIKSM